MKVLSGLATNGTTADVRVPASAGETADAGSNTAFARPREISCLDFVCLGNLSV
jgi:hypothetical protein